MDKRKLIIDCDPGHDDAIAILMAGGHPELEMLGITTVRGNNLLEKTTQNALNICQWLGLDGLPVCRGCAVPLVRDEPPVMERVHGKTGLDGPDFPPTTKALSPQRAHDFIVEQLRKYPGEITLAVTGPMTNIALAMRESPDIVPLIREIVFMGGSWGYGNVTPAAEFNIWADAEAANIVFKSGVPLVMMGLDLTRQALCTPQVIDRMDAIRTKASQLFVELMSFFSEGQKEKYGWPGGPVHDATCIAYLIDPTCIETKNMYATVDISAGPSYGRTNCDAFGLSGMKDNIKVSVMLDVEKFWNIVEQCIRNYH